jgi:thymidylate synthase ThyX
VSKPVECCHKTYTPNITAQSILNNLLKFIDLRTHEGAQWEIQKVAEACLEIAEGLWPVAVGAYRKAKGGVKDGTG